MVVSYQKGPWTAWRNFVRGEMFKVIFGVCMVDNPKEFRRVYIARHFWWMLKKSIASFLSGEMVLQAVISSPK